MTRDLLHLASFVFLLSPLALHAQTAYFDDPTDTILVDGQTVIDATSTYEVRLWLPRGTWSDGMIYDEWMNGQEDKQLRLNEATTDDAMEVQAYNWPGPVGYLSAVVPVEPGVWHHVAFVTEGEEERLYMDGNLIANRSRAGFVVSNSDGLARIGAISRAEGVFESFEGYLDWIRLSDVARYSGETYTPPTSDPPSDASTVLLFTFDEPAGSLTVADSSPLARTGTLGAGFGSATSPILGRAVVTSEPPVSVSRATLETVGPNPFSASTVLALTLPAPEWVRIAVFDARGREIAVLREGEQTAGRHEIELFGHGLAPGAYFVGVTTGDQYVEMPVVVRTR